MGGGRQGPPRGGAPLPQEVIPPKTPVGGQLPQVMAIEAPKEEPLKTATLIRKRVEKNRRSENPAELN